MLIQMVIFYFLKSLFFYFYFNKGFSPLFTTCANDANLSLIKLLIENKRKINLNLLMFQLMIKYLSNQQSIQQN